MSTPPLLKTYNKMIGWPFGHWLFSKAVCMKAPYFGSIKPRITSLEAGKCVARVKNRKAVHNHIGTIHAIAQCNLAELVAGVMTDATVPHKTHRWIPKGMTVEYLNKVETDMQATAQIPMPHEFSDKEDLIVPVEITNDAGELVFRAAVTMYITARKKAD
ncbi:hotdog fold domain-containing protein [Pseudoalteromonas sp. SSDWG2]|uniref:hotdog fold domain-containing protein n=1 Tax=Pseudoalteromonas sp. SSDWG2 TaxID=3139391 RepID=UPI003BAD6204